MRFKVVLLSCYLGLFLYSCKKDEAPVTPRNAESKIAVAFNVSGFTSSLEPMGEQNGRKAAAGQFAKDASLGGVSDIYYTIVSTANGEFRYVTGGHQDSTSANFGVIRDSLLKGSYFISVTATTTPMSATRSLRTGETFPEFFFSRTNFNVDTVTATPLSLTLTAG